jgi:hypothetical protein
MGVCQSSQNKICNLAGQAANVYSRTSTSVSTNIQCQNFRPHTQQWLEYGACNMSMWRILLKDVERSIWASADRSLIFLSCSLTSPLIPNWQVSVCKSTGIYRTITLNCGKGFLGFIDFPWNHMNAFPDFQLNFAVLSLGSCKWCLPEFWQLVPTSFYMFWSFAHGSWFLAICFWI